jgi:O-succinylbenzoic acid--CoA ligase
LVILQLRTRGTSPPAVSQSWENVGVTALQDHEVKCKIVKRSARSRSEVQDHHVRGKITTRVAEVGVPTGDAVLRLLRPLEAALDGSGPALLPVPAGAVGAQLLRAARPADPVDDGIALLLGTSGSTGEPKVVELPASALRASAAATHDRLGGPGRWLLALPVAHVAGWQVLVRSLDAGHPPVVLDLAEGFAARAFAGAAERMVAGRAYTALVPTQLARLLDDPAGTAGLQRFDAVLLGGAAAPAPLLDRARAAGVVVRTTYGSTETCGGCVYDGRPLDGVTAELDASGRVLLAGPVLAAGYRHRPDLTAAAFPRHGGRRWFATSDVGSLDGTGRLTMHGRLDDVLVTGGRKVSPAAVESVLAGLPGVRECLVVGVPDDEWGQAVVALVVGQAPPLDNVRRAVRERLGGPAAPRHVLAVASIPARGAGKPDRAAAARLADRLLAAGG